MNLSEKLKEVKLPLTKEALQGLISDAEKQEKEYSEFVEKTDKTIAEKTNLNAELVENIASLDLELTEKGNAIAEIKQEKERIVTELEETTNLIKIADEEINNLKLVISDFENKSPVENKIETKEPKLKYQTGATKVNIQYDNDSIEIDYRISWAVGNKKGSKVFRKIVTEEPEKETGVKVVKITLAEKDFFVIYTA